MSLIPCPWCNNDGERGIASDNRVDPWGKVTIVWFGECECGARGPHGESPGEAQELWNQRPLIPKAIMPPDPTEQRSHMLDAERVPESKKDET